MTISAEFETTIARRVDDVFAELVDVERWPEWLVDTGVVGVERLDPGRLGEDSRVRIRGRVAGRETVLDARVTAFEPGRRFALRGKDREGITVEIDGSLADQGTATGLRWSLRVGLPLRYRMFESMVAPQARRAVAQDLEAFRARLESAPEG